MQARAYALCLGGIETPRALLNCRSQLPNGIGNEHDLVGRYFCDRPTVATADLLLAGSVGDEPICFAPTAEFAAAHRFANFSLTIEPREVHALDLEDALTTTASCLTPGIQRHAAARPAPGATASGAASTSLPSATTRRRIRSHASASRSSRR